MIATANGATDGFMTGPGAWRIPSQRREIDLPAAHVATPWVLEPSPADAARLLIETLGDLPARQRDALASAARVRAEFTWASAADSLERLAAAARDRGRGGVVSEQVVTLNASEPFVPAKVEELVSR